MSVSIRDVNLAYQTPQDALDGRKKAVNSAKKHLATLAAKIGISITSIGRFSFLIPYHREQ